MSRLVVMVAKSFASAIFEPGAEILMNFEGGPFTVKYWTNYGGTFEVSVPLYLCAEARGLAEDMEAAGRRFANSARGASTLLALVANADVGLLQPEVIFDASPDHDQHEFLQIVLPEPPLRAIPNRRIDIGMVSAVGAAIATHAEAIRLRRAISQYSLALSLWQPGSEIQCLAHLYMGVEALTKAQLRQHLAACNLTEEQLIKEWQIEKKQIDSEVIRIHYLVQLNGQYQGAATGETFNNIGKTDILIRHNDKNVFVAECKFWSGYKGLVETTSQLLGYTTWRDTKTALIIFSRRADFTSVISEAQRAMKDHPNYKSGPKVEGESRFRYTLTHPDDDQREIIVTLMPFNMPKPAKASRAD